MPWLSPGKQLCTLSFRVRVTTQMCTSISVLCACYRIRVYDCFSFFFFNTVCVLECTLTGVKSPLMLLCIISELRVYHGPLCRDLLHHKKAWFGKKEKQKHRKGERVREKEGEREG